MRISEIFSGFQGEAGFAGMPSVWVSFFGCNLKCDGFGQPNPADPSTYLPLPRENHWAGVDSLSDLPVVDLGCDSSYSWANQYKHLSQEMTAEEVAKKIISVMEETFGVRNWTSRLNTPIQLCFTGGEPMLYQEQILEILNELEVLGSSALPQITIETNGTQKPILIEDIAYKTNHIHIACSPKLFNVSGEKNAVILGMLELYYAWADTMCLKFVHNGSDAAWEEMEPIENWYRVFDVDLADIPIYIMPVGWSSPTKEERERTRKTIDKALSKGYHIATRNHIAIFGNVGGR